jgi:hypothetical protein
VFAALDHDEDGFCSSSDVSELLQFHPHLAEQVLLLVPVFSLFNPEQRVSIAEFEAALDELLQLSKALDEETAPIAGSFDVKAAVDATPPLSSITATIVLQQERATKKSGDSDDKKVWHSDPRMQLAAPSEEFTTNSIFPVVVTSPILCKGASDLEVSSGSDGISPHQGPNPAPSNRFLGWLLSLSLSPSGKEQITAALSGCQATIFGSFPCTCEIKHSMSDSSIDLLKRGKGRTADSVWVQALQFSSSVIARKIPQGEVWNERQLQKETCLKHTLLNGIDIFFNKLQQSSDLMSATDPRVGLRARISLLQDNHHTNTKSPQVSTCVDIVQNELSFNLFQHRAA